MTDPVNSRSEKLSPEGQQRREQMLPLLTAEMENVHRRRSQRRTALGITGVLMIAAALWTSGVFESQDNGNRRADNPPAQPEELDMAPMVSFEFLAEANRPDVGERYMVNRLSPRTEIDFELVSDEQLAGLLDEAGLKNKIVGRINGRVQIVSLNDH